MQNKEHGIIYRDNETKSIRKKYIFRTLHIRKTVNLHIFKFSIILMISSTLCIIIKR